MEEEGRLEMKDRDFFDARYFEVSTRLESLRAEAADERRAAAARRRPAVTTVATPAPQRSDADACGGEQRPSRQPA
jgi:hypothetical protein